MIQLNTAIWKFHYTKGETTQRNAVSSPFSYSEKLYLQITHISLSQPAYIYIDKFPCYDIL